MPRDASLTRSRILAAASEEFACFGIAGARVDRIARSADCNKNLLYVHFGNKDSLFDRVFAAAVEEILAAVPFDADDLPAYAGRLFDFHRTHPSLMRLARWHSLERSGSSDVLPTVAQANDAKLTALLNAQAHGRVSDALPAPQLLTLIVSMATSWSEGSAAPFTVKTEPELVAECRRALVQAIAQLTCPQGTSRPR